MSQRTRRNKVAQIEAHRSGFDLERRRSGMSERSFCQNDREQYGTCVDAAQRKGLRLDSFACMHSTDPKSIACVSYFGGVVDLRPKSRRKRRLASETPACGRASNPKNSSASRCTKKRAASFRIQLFSWRRERDSNP